MICPCGQRIIGRHRECYACRADRERLRKRRAYRAKQPMTIRPYDRQGDLSPAQIERKIAQAALAIRKARQAA